MELFASARFVAITEDILADQTTELHDALTMGFLGDLIRKCERKSINLNRVADCITGTRMREEWN
jgi:hypothetical protein